MNERLALEESFDPVAMKEMIKKGQSGADNFIAALDPGDITWA